MWIWGHGWNFDLVYPYRNKQTMSMKMFSGSGMEGVILIAFSTHNYYETTTQKLRALL